MTTRLCPPNSRRLLASFVGILLFSVCFLIPPSARAAEGAKQKVDLPADTAERSLKRLSEQTGAEVLYPTNFAKDVRTNAVTGEYTPREALEKMLDGTGLVAAQDAKTGALTVRKETPVESKNDSSRPASDRAAGEIKDGVLKLDTFEVMGSKLLNMDKPRSRDDAQPYVIFDRDKLTQSNAVNLEDFLKNRLPMNTVGATYSQGADFRGNLSQINLRGLGTTQTLILIDGHRVATPNIFGTTPQTDLNGIPLAAIDRIEILPTTASAIYGGSATGGVINVILRRDYAGAEVKVTYENTFASDSANRRIDFSAGFTLEGGKTNVLIAASFADANQLATADRDFVQRGRARVFANNPGFYLNSSTPILGATTNIRSSNGSNLTLKDGTPLNSPITYVPTGYAGATVDGGAALVANAGKYNLALAQSGQQPGGALQDLRNSPKVESVTATVRRQFTPTVQAFLDMAASNNVSHFAFNNVFGGFTVDQNAPNNPFNQAITVTPVARAGDRETYSTFFDRRIGAGVIVKLPHDWNAETDFAWSQSRWDNTQPTGLTADATTAIANGTLNVLRDNNLYPVDFSSYIAPNTFGTPLRSTLRDVTLRLAGPVWQLPAGATTVTVLLERRDDRLADAVLSSFGDTTFYPSRSQSVNSAYVEANVPLVSALNRKPGVRRLELQIAGRLDDYTIRGATGFIPSYAPAPLVRTTARQSSTNPMIGLAYEPSSDVLLRASFGTGFLPPSMTQIVPNPLVLSNGVIDPRRGNLATGFLPTLAGGNPDLGPEKSKSWSAGLVLSPKSIPGFRLSVDYTRIQKTNNIINLQAQQLVDNENLFPDRVTRGPVPVGDPYGVGPITQLNLRAANFARAEVEAYDIQLDYKHETAAAGTFDFNAVGTIQTHYNTQFLPTSPVIESVGISSTAPLKIKANAGVTWTLHQWTFGWNARYFDSYVVSSNATTVRNQGALRVPSQIYHDLFATYKFGFHSHDHLQARLLSRMEVQVGIKDVFNTSPPVDVAVSGSRYYSPFGDPRLAVYYLSVKKTF